MKICLFSFLAKPFSMIVIQSLFKFLVQVFLLFLEILC